MTMVHTRAPTLSWGDKGLSRLAVVLIGGSVHAGRPRRELAEVEIGGGYENCQPYLRSLVVASREGIALIRQVKLESIVTSRCSESAIIRQLRLHTKSEATTVGPQILYQPNPQLFSIPRGGHFLVGFLLPGMIVQ